ncbi:unnamed protein product [Amoebophrya sp. A120]|nr:unnamed protein product [Amoebophrya sp. A120]|eukprot:GSA120T00005254001.1
MDRPKSIRKMQKREAELSELAFLLNDPQALAQKAEVKRKKKSTKEKEFWRREEQKRSAFLSAALQRNARTSSSQSRHPSAADWARLFGQSTPQEQDANRASDFSGRLHQAEGEAGPGENPGGVLDIENAEDEDLEALASALLKNANHPHDLVAVPLAPDEEEEEQGRGSILRDDSVRSGAEAGEEQADVVGPLAAWRFDSARTTHTTLLRSSTHSGTTNTSGGTRPSIVFAGALTEGEGKPPGSTITGISLRSVTTNEGEGEKDQARNNMLLGPPGGATTLPSQSNDDSSAAIDMPASLAVRDPRRSAAVTTGLEDFKRRSGVRPATTGNIKLGQANTAASPLRDDSDILRGLLAAPGDAARLDGAGRKVDLLPPEFAPIRLPVEDAGFSFAPTFQLQAQLPSSFDVFTPESRRPNKTAEDAPLEMSDYNKYLTNMQRVLNQNAFAGATFPQERKSRVEKRTENTNGKAKTEGDAPASTAEQLNKSRVPLSRNIEVARPSEKQSDGAALSSRTSRRRGEPRKPRVSMGVVKTILKKPSTSNDALQDLVGRSADNDPNATTNKLSQGKNSSATSLGSDQQGKSEQEGDTQDDPNPGENLLLSQGEKLAVPTEQMFEDFILTPENRAGLVHLIELARALSGEGDFDREEVAKHVMQFPDLLACMLTNQVLVLLPENVKRNLLLCQIDGTKFDKETGRLLHTAPDSNEALAKFFQDHHNPEQKMMHASFKQQKQHFADVGAYLRKGTGHLAQLNSAHYWSSPHDVVYPETSPLSEDPGLAFLPHHASVADMYPKYCVQFVRRALASTRYRLLAMMLHEVQERFGETAGREASELAEEFFQYTSDWLQADRSGFRCAGLREREQEFFALDVYGNTERSMKGFFRRSRWATAARGGDQQGKSQDVPPGGQIDKDLGRAAATDSATEEDVERRRTSTGVEKQAETRGTGGRRGTKHKDRGQLTAQMAESSVVDAAEEEDGPAFRPTIQYKATSSSPKTTRASSDGVTFGLEEDNQSADPDRPFIYVPRGTPMCVIPGYYPPPGHPAYRPAVDSAQETTTTPAGDNNNKTLLSSFAGGYSQPLKKSPFRDSAASASDGSQGIPALQRVSSSADAVVERVRKQVNKPSALGAPTKLVTQKRALAGRSVRVSGRGQLQNYSSLEIEQQKLSFDSEKAVSESSEEAPAAPWRGKLGVPSFSPGQVRFGWRPVGTQQQQTPPWRQQFLVNALKEKATTVRFRSQASLQSIKSIGSKSFASLRSTDDEDEGHRSKDKKSSANNGPRAPGSPSGSQQGVFRFYPDSTEDEQSEDNLARDIKNLVDFDETRLLQRVSHGDSELLWHAMDSHPESAERRRREAKRKAKEEAKKAQELDGMFAIKNMKTRESRVHKKFDLQARIANDWGQLWQSDWLKLVCKPLFDQAKTSDPENITSPSAALRNHDWRAFPLTQHLLGLQSMIGTAETEKLADYFTNLEEEQESGAVANNNAETSNENEDQKAHSPVAGDAASKNASSTLTARVEESLDTFLRLKLRQHKLWNEEDLRSDLRVFLSEHHGLDDVPEFDWEGFEGAQIEKLEEEARQEAEQAARMGVEDLEELNQDEALGEVGADMDKFYCAPTGEIVAGQTDNGSSPTTTAGDKARKAVHTSDAQRLMLEMEKAKQKAKQKEKQKNLLGAGLTSKLKKDEAKDLAKEGGAMAKKNKLARLVRNDVQTAFAIKEMGDIERQKKEAEEQRAREAAEAAELHRTALEAEEALQKALDFDSFRGKMHGIMNDHAGGEDNLEDRKEQQFEDEEPVYAGVAEIEEQLGLVGNYTRGSQDRAVRASAANMEQFPSEPPSALDFEDLEPQGADAEQIVPALRKSQRKSGRTSAVSSPGVQLQLDAEKNRSSQILGVTPPYLEMENKVVQREDATAAPMSSARSIKSSARSSKSSSSVDPTKVGVGASILAGSKSRKSVTKPFEALAAKSASGVYEELVDPAAAVLSQRGNRISVRKSAAAAASADLDEPTLDNNMVDRRSMTGTGTSARVSEARKSRKIGGQQVDEIVVDVQAGPSGEMLVAAGDKEQRMMMSRKSKTEQTQQALDYNSTEEMLQMGGSFSVSGMKEQRRGTIPAGQFGTTRSSILEELADKRTTIVEEELSRRSLFKRSSKGSVTGAAPPVELLQDGIENETEAVSQPPADESSIRRSSVSNSSSAGGSQRLRKSVAKVRGKLVFATTFQRNLHAPGNQIGRAERKAAAQLGRFTAGGRVTGLQEEELD